MNKKRVAAAFFLLFLFSFYSTYTIGAETTATETTTISFSADYMSGSTAKKNEITSLVGNAEVTIGELNIKAQEIELSGDDYRYIKAYGSVEGVDKEHEFSFNSDILHYDRKTEIAVFQGEAQFNDQKNEVEAKAQIISYNKKLEIALFQVDVSLIRKKISCTANHALYNRKNSMLDLTGNPLVIRNDDEFKANRIKVNLDTEYITLEGRVSGKVAEEQKEKK